MKFNRCFTHVAIAAVGTLLLFPVLVCAQEEAEPEELEARHYPAIFIGGTTSEHETAPTLALEYGYRFSVRWTLGVVFEFVFGHDEREFLGLIPVHFHHKSWGLIGGIGAELSESSTEDSTEEERTTTFVGRLGLEYVIELEHAIGLEPNINVDISENDTKFVWGLVIAKGF